MATMPAASPSSPSMKFTALIVITTSRMVRISPSCGGSTNTPPLGSGTQESTTWLQTRMAPAATWAASLLIAPIPHRSSMMPVTTSTPPASSRPGTVRGDGNASRR